MPPQVKVSKEQILEVAMEMVRDQGIESVNARSLANKLGCSIHPIFRAFETMDMLKEDIQAKAEEIYDQRMLSIDWLTDEGYRNLGLQYIRFAKEEKNLFHLLFMSNTFEKQSVSDIVDSAEGDDEVINKIAQRTKLTKEHARDIFTTLWLTAHGIATLFATNNCKYSDMEIKTILDNSYFGIIQRLQEEEKNGKRNK